MMKYTFLTCIILLFMGVVKSYDIIVAMTNGGIDSGGFFKIFVHIILPMLPNIMAVVLIMQITHIWNDFLVGLAPLFLASILSALPQAS